MTARYGKSPLILAAVLAAAGLPRVAPSGSSFAAASRGASAPAPSRRQAPRPEAAAEHGARSGPASAASSAAPPGATTVDGWSGPLRLYGDFFGRELTGDLTAADTQDAVARYLPADHGGYELDFVVALVPDPIDSEMPAAFDQALDGIQRGFANRFFLLDRRWLPWQPSTAVAAPPAQSGLQRVSPGLLLFRRDGLVRDDAREPEARCLTAAADLHGEAEHCLVGVFLVGETPKRGIHQAAFLQALQLIRALSAGGAKPGAAAAGAKPAPAGRVPTVKVIGPSYSGSADSLRRAVRLARLTLGAPLDFEIVTGSATAIDTDPATAPAGRESFEWQLECESGGRVSLWRAVLPDRLLQPAALQKLHEKMGWDLTRLALVVEGDTEYGQRLARMRFERRHPGRLIGVVRDAHDRPQPEVRVTVSDQGTGWRQIYWTGRDGSYAAAALPPERYMVTADVQGSQSAIRTDVVVEDDATVTVDLKLGAAATQAPPLRPARSAGGGGDGCETLSVASVSGASPLAAPSSLDVTSKALDRALILHFPTHVAAIRGASAGAAAKQQAAPPPAFSFAPQQTELDLDLADESGAADSIPELSKNTAPENEQAIANLLGEISREGIGYVGILATDVRDKFYLAARIRGFAPDVTLFTFDGDLLYAHRQVEKYTNGMAVLSTFQLFTEGGAALHGVDLDLFHRRQFTSELAEGVFHAVRALLSPSDKWKAQHSSKSLLGWISVTSNGSLWPLLSIELQRRDVELQGYHVLAIADPDTDAGDQRDEPLSQRADLELLIAGVLLCWLARALRHAAPPTPRAPGLLASGLLLLAMAGGLLLALEGIEYLRPFGWLPEGWVDPYPRAHMNAAQWLYLLGLGAAYLVLVYHFAASWRRPYPPPESRPAAWWLGWLAWLGLAAAALAAIWFVLLVWFIPGEVEYFELRARVFSSGLSPVVSLAWLVGALYLWVFLELQRRCVTASHEVEWPLLDSWDPALARCGKLAREVRQLISRLPWGRWVAAGMAAVALLGAWLILRQQVQPAAESPAYAGAFLALLLIAVACSGISFWRFLRVWRKLRSILVRVEETRLKTHFKGLAGEVAWKPMRSFGWQLPRFNTLEISTRKLQALLLRDRTDRPDGLVLPPALDDAFLDRLQRRVSDAFAADVEGSPAHQVECRRRLQRLLTRASRQLGSVRGDLDIEDFLALRVVAYLRYVFAQLRGYLMGGLFPGVLLLIAISCYAFEPKSFCSLGLLAGLLAALAATVAVFVSMNRDAVLSRISGSDLGEVSLDRSFFGNLLTYIVLPLLGLLATQVPAAGSLLDNWLRPLLRIFGLG